jgi:hypothetical protein
MSKSHKGKRERDKNQPKEDTMQENGPDAITLLLKTLQSTFSELQSYNSYQEVTRPEKAASERNEEEAGDNSNELKHESITIEALSKNISSENTRDYEELYKGELKLWIEGQVKLPDFLCDVKFVGRDFFLGKCQILQDDNIMLINGSIRERVQYAAVQNYEKELLKGEIKETVIDIPFKTASKMYLIMDEIKEDRLYIDVDYYEVIDTSMDGGKVFLKEKKEKQIFNKVNKEYILSVKYSIFKYR